MRIDNIARLNRPRAHQFIPVLFDQFIRQTRILCGERQDWADVIRREEAMESIEYRVLSLYQLW
jgi:hypothetical protein